MTKKIMTLKKLKQRQPLNKTWSSVVNILHKCCKLYPDGHFHIHKLFPEMMRKSTIFPGFFKTYLYITAPFF